MLNFSLRNVVIIIISYFISLPFIQAQGVRTILFNDIETEGRVLELTVPSNYEGTYAILGVVKDQQVYTLDFYVRSGKHYYDLRQLKEWSGKVDFLAITLPKEAIIGRKLVKPSLAVEWDIFLDLGFFSPKIINFIRPIILMGYSFTTVLFFLMVISILIMKFLFKKEWWFAAVVGVLISFILMDLRSQADHHRIIQNLEKQYPALDPITEVKRFVTKARPFIVKDGVWSFQGKLADEYYKLFVQYGFVDITYKANIRKVAMEKLYLVTQEPTSKQEIIMEESGFYLVR